jgi:uncharacterized protein YndB with AHSA1/START domain
MNKLTVEKSIWVAAPPERVWGAITQPEQLTVWYAPGCNWEIPALQVGATAKFYNTETDIALHTIRVVDPPRRFALAWEEMGMPMLTTFALEKEKNGTRVTITESGYEQLPPEIRHKRFEETASGYAGSLVNLKAFVENTFQKWQVNHDSSRI